MIRLHIDPIRLQFDFFVCVTDKVVKKQEQCRLQHNINGD